MSLGAVGTSPPERVPRPCRGRRRGEGGQTAVLIVGFAIAIAMTVVVVVDATAGFLRRQALSTLADGAALSAADGIRGRHVYEHGLDERAVVDPEVAEALAARYFAGVAAYRRYPGLEYSVETDGARVVVHVAAPLDLPLRLPGVAERTTVTGRAAAVVSVSD